MYQTNLIKRCKQGDEAAFKELYQTYKHCWFTICARYMSDRDLASDMLQNALIKIIGRIHQFDYVKGTFPAWSNKIVVNECLEYLRSQMHKHNTKEINADSQMIYNGLTPIDTISATELVSLIQRLPDGYRAVFNLHAIEGYTHKEVADKLNITEGTSKSQYFKARKILQKQVEYLTNFRTYGKI